VGVDVEHERPSDLVLFLEEPDGNLIEVWGQGAGVNGTSSSIVRRGASRTQANGVWTLHAFDEVDGSAGIIRGWSLYLTSTFR
jgi:subtilisin-like proprotein convertase family protein